MRVLSNVERANQNREVKCREFVHVDKWVVLEALEEAKLDLEEAAKKELVYALYETELDFWVNLDTGKVTIEGAQ